MHEIETENKQEQAIKAAELNSSELNGQLTLQHARFVTFKTFLLVLIRKFKLKESFSTSKHVENEVFHKTK